MQPLDDLLTYGFLPMLFGSALTPAERKLVALPLRHGGLGISILAEKAIQDYKASASITSELVEKIIKQEDGTPPDVGHKIKLIKDANNLHFKNEIESIKKDFSLKAQRCI